MENSSVKIQSYDRILQRNMDLTKQNGEMSRQLDKALQTIE